MSEQVNSLNIPTIKSKRAISFSANNAINAIPTQNIETAKDSFTSSTSMQGATAVPTDDTSKTPMQGSGIQNIQQTVGETELGNRVKNSSEMGQSPYTMPVTLATWYAIAQGMDKFGKAAGGTYEQSILGKVSGAADKLSNSVTESKFAKSSFGQFLGKIGSSISNYFNKVTSNPKNRTLYALRNTPTRPECKFVVAPAAGVDGFLVMDTTKSVFEEFLKPANKAIQLEQYGKDKAYIDNFLQSVKGLSKKEKLLKLQEEELKYFGVKAADIAGKSQEEITKLLKDLKITKGLGFKDIAEYEKFLKDEYAVSHMSDFAKILRRGDQKLKIMIWKGDGILGKIKGHFFGRELSVSELANKFEFLTTGAKTKFGKFVSKAFAYLTEGCTNRYAGGKLAVFMQAFIFADMFIHAAKAPSGEKGKTLIERFVNDFTYFLALPLGIGLMHMAGGLKYLGMSQEQVKAFRESLNLFKNRVALGDLTKKGFKMRKKVLERQLNAGVKNPFLKLLKKGANLLTVGLERMPTYKSSDKLNLNWLRKSNYFGKNVLGYIIRFAIPMFMLSPMFAKWTTKATHKIFGRPTNSVLDEDKSEDEKPEQTNQPQISQNPKIAASPVKPTVKNASMQGNGRNYQSDTNLIKMTLNNQNPASQNSGQTTVTTQVNTTTQSQQSSQQPDPNSIPEPVRTYIPSPQGIVLQQPDMTAAEEAMANADKAEQNGYEVLKSI